MACGSDRPPQLFYGDRDSAYLVVDLRLDMLSELCALFGLFYCLFTLVMLR